MWLFLSLVITEKKRKKKCPKQFSTSFDQALDKTESVESKPLLELV